MQHLEDQHYIQLLQKGNHNYYAVLVDRYKDMVYTLALKMLQNKEEAEEVAQDTFLKAFQAIANFKGDSKFSTWLYRITYNTCLDKLKKLKKEKTTTYIEDFSEHQVKAIESIIDTLAETERNKAIQDCLDTLPAEDSFLITLYYFDGKSVEEIAKVMQITTDNVKIKLYRTRKKLAAIFQQKLAPEIVNYYENNRR